MLHKIPIGAVILGLFCASGASAQDLCFQYTTSGGGVFVAKGLTLPPANSCKPFNAAEKVVRALIQAANDAGGKDNITAVYVERAVEAPHGVPDLAPPRERGRPRDRGRPP